MSTTVKNRIRQLYAFLREANQLRFRPVRLLTEHPRVVHLDDMPRHESMHLYRPVQVQDAEEIPETLLRVTRPAITPCPRPPEGIASWLLPGWDDPTKPAAYAETRNDVDESGETITVRFDSDEQRSSDFVTWDDQRTAWTAPELRARRALRFFELFYDIYSSIEKDREDLELMIGEPALHLGSPFETRSGGYRTIPHAASDWVDNRGTSEDVMACGRPLARPTTYTIVMSADLLKIDLFRLASRLTHKDTHSRMSAYKGDWRRTCRGRFVPKLCLKMSVVAI